MTRLSIILILLLLGCDSSSSQDDAVDEQPGDIEGWTLVWNDEFEGEGLPDASKWSYNVGGHGWGNDELQNYTENRLRNARLENGNLVIEAVKESFEGSDYTSARLVTKGKGDWTYGRFEIRAKLPSGRGTWPAIWMLASQNEYGAGFWPDNGEIDIMEHVGYDPDVVHSTVHTLAYNHRSGTQKGDQITVSNARSAFNVYRIEWDERAITAYVNDELYFHFRNERLTEPSAGFAEWPFDKPFHVILNIAVGGDWGGAQGVDDSIWPQRMEVDYVRVYKKADD
jgi:licheninase